MILAVSLGVNRGSLGITITAQFFRLTIRLSQQNTTLTVGVGTNALRQLVTLGPVLARFTLTLGAHALEHATVDFFWQVDGLDANVDHFDAQLFFSHFVQRGRDVSHQGIPLTRHHFVQGALAELVTQAGFQTARQALVSNLLHAGGGGVEALGIFHAPLGEGINHYSFLFQRQKTLSRRIQRHQAGVELAHLVNVRNLHVQAGLDIRLNHTAEAQQNRAFGLRDDVEAVPGHHCHDYADNKGDQRFIAHQRLSLVRGCCGRSVLTCEAASLLVLAAAAEPVAGVLLPLRPSIILSSGR